MTGDDVDEYKPSGDGVKKIMKKFFLLPTAVLIAGDAVADVKAARESSVEIASVLWDSYGRNEILQLSSDFIFYNINDFFEWLKKIYNIT